jgi:prolipoprotein diacylglyceryltransferase
LIFPVEFKLWHLTVSAHQVLEVAGWTAGSALFVALRRRFAGPSLADERGLWVIVGCLAGAALGSKVLAILESLHAYWPVYNQPGLLLGGKTIVGGLAGGWAGVEIAKRAVGIRQSTGDRFVFPILLGLAIGRVGCFLEGLPDHTYGIATSLPWAVDFGDGVRRHPTQLYEVVFCVLLAIGLLFYLRRKRPPGELFQLFALWYFLWRFAVEFIKPRETYGGLSPIQMVCIVAALAAARNIHRLRRQSRDPSTPAPIAAGGGGG